MKQVKEEGWEVLSFPSADAMPRMASSLQPQARLACEGNRRSTQTNAFPKFFISAFLPQMFRCHGVYHLLITHGLFICYKHCSGY